jgi:predicted SAM-dependent methyltransferase
LANPDVSAAVSAGQFQSGFAHYQLAGKKEGRVWGRRGELDRQEKVMAGLNRESLGLEIGPSHNPIAPKRDGYNVHILDHLDRAALRNKYADHGQYGVNIENIEEVDFVWQGQPLSKLIGQTNCYDWIIVSHVIEHVPDLITFFQQCEVLLKAEGRLSLVIPDKRYCFDHLNPYSSTGEFLDAFEAKRARPSVGKVFDHFANACKRGGKIAWNTAENGQFELIHSVDQARSLWEQARSTDTYIDTHCWRFTPQSFRLVLADFTMLGLSGLKIVREFGTVGCEFYVTLGKSGVSTAAEDRLSILQARKLSDT